MQPAAECPVCLVPLEYPAGLASGILRIQCRRCGTFHIDSFFADSLAAERGSKRQPSDKDRCAVGYWLRREQAAGRRPELDDDRWQRLTGDRYLPEPQEQLECLVRIVGSRTQLGVAATLTDWEEQYALGATSPKALRLLSKELERLGLAHRQGIPSVSPEVEQITLTLAGWSEYERLKRGGGTGHRAFLAMPFGRVDLDGTIVPVAKAACADCGFTLMRQDEQARPGIIDVQIRVAIKEARFLVVDLTYANLGAYWEAGFGEGLAKPVIYTVRHDHDAHVHFDTAHLSRVIWHEDRLDQARAQIAAMIRNAIPDARPASATDDEA